MKKNDIILLRLDGDDMNYKILSMQNELITLLTDNNIEEFKNIIHKHLVFEESDIKIISEIINLKKEKDNYELQVKIIGEIKENKFYFGIQNRPSMNSGMRFLSDEELDLLLGTGQDKLTIGFSPLYNNHRVEVDINTFFSNHFSILGSTGSGKSYSMAYIIQNLFSKDTKIPYKASIFIFDAYGEYKSAFEPYFKNNDDINFKSYTTNTSDPYSDKIQIPVWLLDVDDLALLLNVSNHSQIPILDKTLQLVRIFKSKEANVSQYKNHILATALLDILLGGERPTLVRDQVFSVLTSFNTPELNLESRIVQPGWNRTLRQCFIIDTQGKLLAMEQISEFLMAFIKDEFRKEDTSSAVVVKYSLSDLKDALVFAMISEGILKSDKVFDYANSLKVRLESLINGEYSKFFIEDGYSDIQHFIETLTHTKEGKKAQIINFSINYVDDRFAKVITKIFSKMIFNYTRGLEKRASKPMHIFLEEAHRYVQNDRDVELLGYNIFERIAKEGRKFGVLLGLITQRPSELSETVMSQCSNFLLFKLIHPKDINFVKEVIPDISVDIISKISYLTVGNCIAFGPAFKIPLLTRIGTANPPPYSSNCDVEKLWFRNEQTNPESLETLVSPKDVGGN